jgi:orotidine-5'-phosphate decarboxylase
MIAKDRLIVALDVDQLGEVHRLVRVLQGQVGMFKIGLEPFCLFGPAIVAAIQDEGGQVFLDLKFHDIPRTVAQAARAAVRMGVAMFNIHIAGGQEMLTAAVDAARDEAGSQDIPKILGVTVLTSLGSKQLQDEVGLSRTPEEQVLFWAVQAKSCGLSGVVASPREIRTIRERCGQEFLIVTPGIRPAGSVCDDQKRIGTPGEALRSGADYLVVGRPIVKAADPVAAAVAIVQEMEVAAR